MAESEQITTTLDKHHETFTYTAKVVIILQSLCLLAVLVDVTLTLIYHFEAIQQRRALRESISSTAAEARVTVHRLDEFIEMSKKRWTFLRDDNQGKITVPALTPEEKIEVELSKPPPVPTPRPTATITIKQVEKHRAKRTVARRTPSPKPWFHFGP